MDIYTFIDDEYIKDQGLITSNVEVSSLKAHIVAVQGTYVKNLLGSTLYTLCYNYIKEFIDNGTAIPEPYYTLIYEHIQNVHFWYFMYMIPSALDVRYTNIGMSERSSDGVNPADDTKILSQKRDSLKYAEQYVAACQKYIEEQNLGDCKTQITRPTYGIYLGPSYKNRYS